jgi:pimeloyl-ACP methyl ester carboxylesterase
LYAQDLSAVNWQDLILDPARTIPEEVAERHLVASADGTRVALYRWRHWDVQRPTVLFQHANGFNAGCYLPFLARLATRCNIFSVDMRGHGASDKPDPEKPPSERDYYAPPASGEDMTALRRHIDDMLGPDVPIHLASHSQGGIGSIIYAAANGPDAFASMTMFEPPLMPFDEPDREVSLRRAASFAAWAARRRVFFPSAADFETEFDAIQTYQSFDPRMREAHLASLIADTGEGFELRCPGVVEGKVYERNPSHPVPELVGDVEVRGIMYSSDPAVSRGHGWYDFFRRITEPSPGLDAAIMTGCRHLMVQEDPQSCADAVFRQIFR